MRPLVYGLPDVQRYYYYAKSRNELSENRNDKLIKHNNRLHMSYIQNNVHIHITCFLLYLHEMYIIYVCALETFIIYATRQTVVINPSTSVCIDI